MTLTRTPDRPRLASTGTTASARPATSEPTRRTSRRLSTGLLYAILVVAGILTLLPFVWVVSGSLRTLDEIRADPGAWLPSAPTLDNFVRLFTGEGFAVYLVNSLVVAAIVVLGNIVTASLAGYALSKFDFRGKKLAFGAVLAALMVPYTAVFVPQFVVTVNLGLVDTLAGIAGPSIALPLSIFIMRQYASSVPDELLEAARLDGAGEFRIFFRVFLPLAGPAVATITIMSFLNSWNNFIWPLIVAQSTRTYTLPVGLAATNKAAANLTDYGLSLAGALVVMLPVLVLFLFLQRYFVQGIAATGIR